MSAGQSVPDDETQASLDVVRAWVAAINAVDIPGVVSRSAHDIVLGGPRGAARGQKELRDWVERARLLITVERTFAAGRRVVIRHRAVWRDPQGLPVAEADQASRFDVAGDRVSSVVRYDALEAALAEAGLSERDEWT